MEGLSNQDKKYIEAIFFFKHLQKNEFNELYQVSQIRHIPKDTILITQGEHAETACVILDGEVEVYIVHPSGEYLVLAILSPGDLVGEEIIKDPEAKHERSANVLALTDVKILEIPASFIAKHNLPAKKVAQRRASDTFDRMLKLMTGLHEVEITRDQIAYIQEEFFEPDSIIFSEREDAKAIYFIINGSVRFTKKKGGVEKVLSRTFKGQFFGEIGLLEQQTRHAAAIAQEFTHVLKIDKELFKKWYESYPIFKDMLKSLRHAYHLQDNSFINVYLGKYEDKDCINTFRSSSNGDSFISIKIINEETVIFYKIVKIEEKHIRHIVYKSKNIKRELQLVGDKIVGIVSSGHWVRISQVINKIINSEPLASSSIELFQQRGEINLEYASQLIKDNSIICQCMSVTNKDICHFISKYGDNVEKIIESTGATLVCGTCKILIDELLGKSEWISLNIISSELIANNIWSLELQAAGNDLPSALPGQHIVLRTKIEEDWIQRSYSLVPSSNKNTWKIMVLRQPFGIMSNLLTKNSESMILQASKPKGHFLISQDSKEVVFFAAGIGVTPALAMLHNNHTNFFLHYSAATEADFIFKDELLKNPHIQLHCTSTEGHLTYEQVETILKKHPTANIMLCGSPEYHRLLLHILKDLNIPPSKIKIETFKPDEPSQALAKREAKAHILPIFASNTADEVEMFLNDIYSGFNMQATFFKRLKTIRAEIKKFNYFIPTIDEVFTGIKILLLHKKINISHLHILDKRNSTVADLEQVISDHQYFSDVSENNFVITIIPNKIPINSQLNIIEIELTKFCKLTAMVKFPKGMTMQGPLNYVIDQTHLENMPVAQHSWTLKGFKNLIQLCMNPIKLLTKYNNLYNEGFAIQLPDKRISPLYFLDARIAYNFLTEPPEIIKISQPLQINDAVGLWFKRSKQDPDQLQALILACRKMLEENLLNSPKIMDTEFIAALTKKHILKWNEKFELVDVLVNLIYDISASLMLEEKLWSDIKIEAIPLFKVMSSSLDIMNLVRAKLPLQAQMPEYLAVKKLELLIEKVIADNSKSDFLNMLRQIQIENSPLAPLDLPWVFMYIIWNAVTYPGIYGVWCLLHILSNAEIYSDLQKQSIENKRLLIADCLTETLRLNPVVSQIRKLACPINYSTPNKNFYIPKESNVGLFPYAVCQNKDLYSKPNHFNPLRYAAGEKKPDLLFGKGPFACVGETYTYTLLTTLLAYVFHTYRIELISKPIKPLSRMTLLYPNSPILVNVIKNP
jgi:ferredoxin-NADP reductase/CRP-like cAMP-binding protein